MCRALQDFSPMQLSFVRGIHGLALIPAFTFKCKYLTTGKQKTANYLESICRSSTSGAFDILHPDMQARQQKQS